MEARKAVRKSVMSSAFEGDLPPSVMKVLKKIDTIQLLRAKQDISERLGTILRRVNLALENYMPETDSELMESAEIGTVSRVFAVNRRKQLLHRLSMFLQTSSVIEGGLENILKWLFEWSHMLTDMCGEDELRNKWKATDEWIEKQEAEITKCLDATQKCIKQLANLYYILSESGIRIQDKGYKSPVQSPSSISEGRLDMVYAMKIKNLKQQTTKQMLEDEPPAIKTAFELFHMLQTIAVSPQCNEEQGTIYLCISFIIRNLSRAFDVRSKEYHALESELIFLRAEKQKIKTQFTSLLKDFHNVQEQKEFLQVKLQGIEAKAKQLHINLKTVRKLEDAEKLEQKVIPESKKEIIPIDKKRKIKKEQMHAEKESEPESNLQSADSQWPEQEHETEADLDYRKELMKAESLAEKALSTVSQSDESEIKPGTEREIKTIVGKKKDYHMIESDIKTALEAKIGHQMGFRKVHAALDSIKGFQKQDRAKKTGLVARKESQMNDKASQTDLDDEKGIYSDEEAIETALDDGKGIDRDKAAKEAVLVDGKGTGRDKEAKGTALDDGKRIRSDKEAKDTALDDGKRIRSDKEARGTALDDGKRIQREDKVREIGVDDVMGIQEDGRATQAVLDKKMEFQKKERKDAQTVLEDRRESQRPVSDLKILLDIRKKSLKKGLFFRKGFQEDESDTKITAMDQERISDLRDEYLVVTALEEFQRSILSFLNQIADTSRKPSDESLQAKEILSTNPLVLQLYSTTEDKIKDILEKIKENIYVELKEQKSMPPRLPKFTSELKMTMAEDLKYPVLPEQPESSLLMKPSVSMMAAEPEAPCTTLSGEPVSVSWDMKYSELSQFPRLQKAGELPSEDKSTWSQAQLQKQPEDEYHLPHTAQVVDYTILKPHQQLSALQTKAAEVVSAMEGDSAVYMEKLPGDETTLIITQPPISMQQLEKEWLAAKLPEKDERYCIDVKSQRENLELLSKACRMLVLPSEVYNLAKDLIQQILDIDTTRLAHLFRKYISFRLIQNVRQILTIRANKAQTTGDVTAMVGLYVFLERLDIYQTKILHRWIDKQTTTAETRSSCFSKMIYLFNKLRVNYKLHLFQPVPMPICEQVKLQDCQCPYKQRLGPWTSPLQYLKPKFPVIQPEFLVSRVRKPKYNVNAIWRPGSVTEDFHIGEKQPLLSVWSTHDSFPDVPRLLELDVHLSKNKALRSLQMRIQEFPK